MTRVYCATVQELEETAARLAVDLQQGVNIHLRGELGAGKTSFARGFLRGAGYQGTVKSPTYTLVESYQPGALQIYHFDFYRISAPAELESAGIRDYFTTPVCCLVEWPERGGAHIPAADLHVEIRFAEPGRELRFTAASRRGRQLLAPLQDAVTAAADTRE